LDRVSTAPIRSQGEREGSPAGTVPRRWGHGRRRPEPRRSSENRRFWALDANLRAWGDRGEVAELTRGTLEAWGRLGDDRRQDLAEAASLHAFGDQKLITETKEKRVRGVGRLETFRRGSVSGLKRLRGTPDKNRRRRPR